MRKVERESERDKKRQRGGGGERRRERQRQRERRERKREGGGVQFFMRVCVCFQEGGRGSGKITFYVVEMFLLFLLFTSMQAARKVSNQRRLAYS